MLADFVTLSRSTLPRLLKKRKAAIPLKPDIPVNLIERHEVRQQQSQPPSRLQDRPHGGSVYGEGDSRPASRTGNFDLRSCIGP